MEIYRAMEDEKYASDYMATLVRNMVTALVDDALSLSVVATPGDAGAFGTIAVTVAQSDLGKVIGKQGRTARSLRTIVGAACMRMGMRFSLDILGGTQ